MQLLLDSCRTKAARTATELVDTTSTWQVWQVANVELINIYIVYIIYIYTYINNCCLFNLCVSQEKTELGCPIIVTETTKSHRDPLSSHGCRRGRRWPQEVAPGGLVSRWALYPQPNLAHKERLFRTVIPNGGALNCRNIQKQETAAANNKNKKTPTSLKRLDQSSGPNHGSTLQRL